MDKVGSGWVGLGLMGDGTAATIIQLKMITVI